jgi:predicted nucleic acid-binding protein
MTTLIIDANIILSALLGRSLALVEGIASKGIELFVPVAQWMEVRAVLHHLRPEIVDELMDKMSVLVDILPVEAFVSFQSRACERLEKEAQTDWPVLASAMALEAGIWSKDRDFFGVGVPVWDTRNIHFC